MIIILLITTKAFAGDLTLLGGIMHSWNSEVNDYSYSWMFEYREELNKRFAGSFSYLNEGHIPGHHRDGMALQLWTKSDLMNKRLTLSGGIGPYYYFNTTSSSDNSFQNDHDPGVLFSLAAIWRSESPWIFQFRTNWVKTINSIDSVSALAGIGYQLNPTSKLPERSESATETGKQPKKNEVTLFAGRTITNSFESEQSISLGMEYRRALMQYMDMTVSWLYEADTRLIRRNGLVSQLWAVKAFQNDQITLGFGAGAYVAINRQTHDKQNGNDSSVVSGIATMSGSYRPDPDWSLRVSWNRIITNYNRDTDVIMGGIGYRF